MRCGPRRGGRRRGRPGGRRRAGATGLLLRRRESRASLGGSNSSSDEGAAPPPPPLLLLNSSSGDSSSAGADSPGSSGAGRRRRGRTGGISPRRGVEREQAGKVEGEKKTCKKAKPRVFFCFLFPWIFFFFSESPPTRGGPSFCSLLHKVEKARARPFDQESRGKGRKKRRAPFFSLPQKKKA